MVKKKLSGQTVTIIILACLLLITIVFGGVYAFQTARSNKVSGKIVMANLKISLDTDSGESDKSEIVISREEHFVPGQYVDNYPLIIRNLSTVDVYLIVVYQVNAKKPDEDGNIVDVDDAFDKSLISVGVDYYNPLKNITETHASNRKEWVDFVFEGTNEDTGETKKYRCLVSTVSFKPTSEKEAGITVIEDDQLMLSRDMNDDYQTSTISLTFQAYAIAANSFDGVLTSQSTPVEKSQAIVSAIYESQDYNFLTV